MLFKSFNCLMKELYHFFITFSYNFYILLKLVKKLITSQLQDLPCSSQILTTFNLYSGRPRMGLYEPTISKRSYKQWFRFKEGGFNPPGQICKLKRLDQRRVNRSDVICLEFDRETWQFELSDNVHEISIKSSTLTVWRQSPNLSYHKISVKCITLQNISIQPP